MFSFVLATLAAAVDQKFCFYSNDAGVCPAEYKAYSLDQFDEFAKSTFPDVTSAEFLITCDMQEKTFSFGGFTADGFTPLFTGTSQFHVSISFADLHVKHLSLKGLNVTGLMGFSGELDTFTLENTVLPAIRRIVVGDFKSDAKSLNAFGAICPKNMSITMGSGLESDVVSVMIESSDEWSPRVEVRGATKNATIQVNGSLFKVQHVDCTGYLMINGAEALAVSHCQTGVVIDVMCLYTNVIARPTNMNFEVSNGAILSFPESLWPNADYMKSLNLHAILTVLSVGGYIRIANRNTPMALTLDASTLELLAENVTIMGQVAIKGSVNIKAEKVKKLDIASLLLGEGAESFSLSDARVNIHVLEAPETAFAFTGSAIYSIGTWPDAVYDLSFENLDVTGQITAQYNLTGQSLVNVKNRVEGSELNVLLRWSGNAPTEEELMEHKGMEVEVVKIPAGPKINVIFPSDAAHGFCSATHVFTDTSTETSAKVELDHDYTDFSSLFCWDPSGNMTCMGISLNTTESINSYVSYIRPDAEILQFEIGESPIDGLDLSVLEKRPLTLSLTCSAEVNVRLSRGIFESAVDLVIKGGVIEIDDETQMETVKANGSWKLTETVFNSDSAERLDCRHVPQISADATSIKGEVFRTCKPARLEFVGADEYSQVVFQKDHVQFTGGNSEDTLVYVTEQSLPLVVFTVSRPDLTMVPAPGITVFWPVIEFMNVHSNHTLTLGDFPNDFHGIFGYAIDGTVIPEGSWGQVPMDIIGNRYVDFLKAGDVDVVYPFCTNTRLVADSMSVGSELKIEEAYFGKKTNITIKDGVTFNVINGYYNQHGPIIAPLNNMRLTKNLTVYSYGEFPVDNFDFLGTEGQLWFTYRLAEMPTARLDRPANHSEYAPIVTFAYDSRDDDEIVFLRAHKDELKGLEWPVVCGVNLACERWAFVFWGAGYAELDGPTNLLEAVCRDDVTDANRQCVVLQMKGDGGGGTDDGSDWDMGSIIAVTIIAAIGVGLAIVITVACVLRKRDRKLRDLNSCTLLTADKALHKD